MTADAAPAAVPAGIRRGSTYFPELESLRGIAIILVFAFHADGTLLFPFMNRLGSAPTPVLAYVYAGHTGVTLFFVLSAFLLSLPFFEAAYDGRPASWRRFYERRALRILPLYYAIVLLGTLLTSPTFADLRRGVPYLFFAESRPNSVVPMPPWSSVWWSLATEVQFYAILPLVALAFARSRMVTLGLIAVFAVVFGCVATGAVLPGLEPWLRAQSVLGRSPVFLCGILAAWLWYRHGDALRGRLAASRWARAGGGDVLLLVVLLALGLLLRWSTFFGFMALEPSRLFPWHVPEGVLWALVLLILLVVPLKSKPLFSNRALARLGILSYSIYMLHVPVFHYTLPAWRAAFPDAGVGWNLSTGTWFVLAAGLCIALASLTYRCIERPFLVRKARLDVGEPVARARAA